MADGDGAAVRIDARVLEIHVHELEAAEHLARKGLVYLDDVHVGELEAGALERARDRIRRTDAHDARLDAGARGRADANQGLFAVALAPLAAAEDERRGAVIDTGGVAGGDHAAFEERLQLGERL